MRSRTLSEATLGLLDATFGDDSSFALGAAIDYRIATDHALIEAMRDGDRRALNELVTRHHEECRAIALRAPGVHSERHRLAAEDAAWDTLLTVLARLCDRARPIPDPLSSYLANAVRTALRQAIHAGRDQMEIGDAEVLGLLPRAVDQDDVVNAEDDSFAARLAGLQMVLSEVELQVFRWLSNGIPRAQVAEWIGRSPEQVSQVIESVRHRVMRVVRIASPAAVARPGLSRKDASDLVTAFVTSRPARERAAVASALREFAVANDTPRVPVAIQRYLTKSGAVAASMLERPLTAAARVVVRELGAFARANGYDSGHASDIAA